MDKVTAALLLIVAVHVIAVVVLFWAIVDGDRRGRPGWWPGGDDGRGPGQPPADGPRGPDRDGLPLPDAGSADVRLRSGHERLRDARRRARRPEHAPSHAPSREPV